MQKAEQQAAEPPCWSGPKVITEPVAGGRDVPDGPGAAGGTEQGDLYGRIAISLTVLALALHVGGVVTRALSVERAPWGNMYEFSTTFATVAVGVYLAAARAEEERPLDRAAPGHHRPARPRPGRLGALHRQRPAGPGAALVLAVDPRLLRDHLRRGALPRRGLRAALPLPGPYEAKLADPSGSRPAAFAPVGLEPAAVRGVAGQVRVPHQRRGLPAVDLHHHRGRDLGRGGLGPLLGLGPQGGLGLHHLGRLRLLSARPGHRRLEGPQGRLPGA